MDIYEQVERSRFKVYKAIELRVLSAKAQFEIERVAKECCNPLLAAALISSEVGRFKSRVRAVKSMTFEQWSKSEKI